MFSHLLGWYTIFRGSCLLTGFCQVQNSLCVQVLRYPISAVLLHGTRAVVVIGWAAITSGNGPHSSLASLLFQGCSAVVLGHPERDPLGYPERIVTGRVIFPSPSHQNHSTERNMVSSAERKVNGAILLPRVQTGCSSPFLRPSSP